MKRCLQCNQLFNSIKWYCPRCGWQPERSSGVLIFAAELAQSERGFKASYFNPLADLEADHFWFRVRNAIITWALGKYGPTAVSFLEVGCGTGFVLQSISHEFPTIRLAASDIYPEGIAFAAERVSKAEFMQMDAGQIPFVAEFDVVGVFDVIEHIDEDVRVLQQIHRTLKTKGLLLLTVPQHQWLWSAADKYAYHMRRYGIKELHDKVIQAGFKIWRSTSFVTSLLPFMWVSRLVQRVNPEDFDPYAELRINPVLNRILEWFLRMELWLIRKGVSFPLGGSRFIVATKVEENSSS